MRTLHAFRPFVLALGIVVAPLSAQDAAPSAGQPVRLTLRDGATIVGRFAAWSDDTVRVARDGTVLAIARPQVVRWQEPVPGTRRSRWLAGLGWGALIGTVGGAVVGVAAAGTGDCSRGGWCIMADIGRTAYAIGGASIGLVVGGASGAVIGATMHAEDWRDRPDLLRR